MTPEEHAEKIVLASRQDRYSKAVALKEMIAVEMEAYASERVEAVRADLESQAGFDCDKHCTEAVEEAYKKALSDYAADGLQIALEQGRREAYEDAAKIAGVGCCPVVAKQIQARAAVVCKPDGGNEK